MQMATWGRPSVLARAWPGEEIAAPERICSSERQMAPSMGPHTEPDPATTRSPTGRRPQDGSAAIAAREAQYEELSQVINVTGLARSQPPAVFGGRKLRICRPPTEMESAPTV